MIVCSCNVLSDEQIRSTVSAAEGARTTVEVYRCLGCSPQCGRCAATINAIMKEALGHACEACPQACLLPKLIAAE